MKTIKHKVGDINMEFFPKKEDDASDTDYLVFTDEITEDTGGNEITFTGNEFHGFCEFMKKLRMNKEEMSFGDAIKFAKDGTGRICLSIVNLEN